MTTIDCFAPPDAALAVAETVADPAFQFAAERGDLPRPVLRPWHANPNGTAELESMGSRAAASFFGHPTPHIVFNLSFQHKAAGERTLIAVHELVHARVFDRRDFALFDRQQVSWDARSFDTTERDLLQTLVTSAWNCLVETTAITETMRLFPHLKAQQVNRNLEKTRVWRDYDVVARRLGRKAEPRLLLLATVSQTCLIKGLRRAIQDTDAQLAAQCDEEIRGLDLLRRRVCGSLIQLHKLRRPISDVEAATEPGSYYDAVTRFLRLLLDDARIEPVEGP